MLMVQPDGTSNPYVIGAETSGTYPVYPTFKIQRNGSDLCFWQGGLASLSGDSALPVYIGTPMMFLDTPSSGSYNYTVWMKSSANTSQNSSTISNAVLMAYEL